MTLRFHPHMSLLAAARIADTHGLRLVVTMHEGQLRVTTQRIPTDDFVPMFLREQAL